MVPGALIRGLYQSLIGKNRDQIEYIYIDDFVKYQSLIGKNRVEHFDAQIIYITTFWVCQEEISKKC